jgi:hypothetical protein
VTGKGRSEIFKGWRASSNREATAANPKAPHKGHYGLALPRRLHRGFCSLRLEPLRTSIGVTGAAQRYSKGGGQAVTGKPLLQIRKLLTNSMVPGQDVVERRGGARGRATGSLRPGVAPPPAPRILLSEARDSKGGGQAVTGKPLLQIRKLLTNSMVPGQDVV